MSTLAKARKQYPHLNDYTDQELLGIIAASNKIAPGSATYKQLESQLLGYDRSWGETAVDFLTGMGQTASTTLGGIAGAMMNPNVSLGAHGMGGWKAVAVNAPSAVFPAMAKTAINEIVPEQPGALPYNPHDNPGTRAGAAVAAKLDPYKSTGLRNMQLGQQVREQITDREIASRDLSGWGKFLHSAGDTLEGYWEVPALAAHDTVSNLPTTVMAGGAGWAGRGLALTSGAAAKTAARVGFGTAVGAGGALHGQDIGRDTYQRALAAGATPEQAAAAADDAALKAGAISIGINLLPGMGGAERAMVGALERKGVGALARPATALKTGAGEFTSEAAEEGSGKYVSNVGVQQFDPTVDPWSGVGNAAAKGGVAGMGTGMVLGMGSRPALPRTEDGNIDLTQPPRQNARTGPDPLDIPTYQRRGLDPLRTPWQNPDPDASIDFEPTPIPAPAAAPLALGEYQPQTYGNEIEFEPSTPSPVDARLAPQDTALPAHRASPKRPYQEPVPLLGEPPVATAGLPRSDVVAATPGVSTLSPPGVTASAEDVIRNREGVRAQTDAYGPGIIGPDGRPLTTAAAPNGMAPDGFPLPPPVETVAGAEPATPAVNRGTLLRALAAANATLGRNDLRKDGEVKNTAGTLAIRQVLESPDPLAAIREMHQDGANARDEMLDVWHANLTGQSVFEWKAAQEAQSAIDTAAQPELNSAGYVAEPQAQVDAQVKAARKGRKKAVVVGTEQAAKTDLTGLHSAQVTDPVNGETAVVASADPAVVEQAVARTAEVGMRQALGEAQGVVDPTATTTNDGNVVAVQQTDNETGEVLADEIVPADRAAEVAPIPGATAAVLPAAQPAMERAAAAEPAQAKVTRAADFKTSGNYDVQVGDQAFQISRNPEDGWWYRADTPGAREHQSRRVVGFTKAEAIAAIEKLAAERAKDQATKTAEQAASPAKKGGGNGRKSTDELIEIADNTKDEKEYEDARFEMYKRWMDDTDDGQSVQYLLSDVRPKPEHLRAAKAGRDPKLLAYMASAEAKAFAQRLQQEREAAGEKAGQEMGKKFDASFRMSSGTSGRGSVTKGAAEGILAALTRTWKQMPKVEVVERIEDLPADLLAQARRDGALTAKGALDANGTVWVVAANHTSPADVVSTILHEIAGHFGLRAVLGAKFNEVMRAIYDSNADVREAADAMIASEGLSIEEAVDEVLADAAETGRVELSILERIGNAIRQMLRAIGLASLASKYTNAEVKALIVNARNAVKYGDAAKGRHASSANPSYRREELPETIEVNGQQRPTTNNKGRPIAATEDGVRNFWNWFGASRMTNKGRPGVLYHSTDATFTVFDKSKVGANTGHASAGLGFFLTADREASERYGQHVMPAYVKLENPYMMGLEEFSGFDDAADAVRRREELQALGHDGIFVRTNGTTIVFEPNQIKSATSNTGAFDAANPDIRYRHNGLTIQVGEHRRPIVNSRGQKVGNSFSEQMKFWNWFGDSPAVDEHGQPLVLFRGMAGPAADTTEITPRDGYAVFASTSPHVASTYANPSYDSGTGRMTEAKGNVGAVYPVYAKVTRLIEFPVGKRFDMFEFDRRAKLLGPGEALVARGVYDSGPRATRLTDPTAQYSYAADTWAFGKGTSFKSATGNDGTFDAGNPDIRYRRAGATTSVFDTATRSVLASLRAQLSGKEISPSLLSAMTLRQIVEQFGDKLPALRNWAGAIMERSANASKLAAEADRVAQKWEKSVQNAAERDALSDILLRASVAELRLDDTTDDYLDTLDAAQLAEHTALRDKLAALSPAAQEARREALAILQRQWEYTRTALESFINHTIADPALRAQRIADLQQEMGRNRGDYFPLSRFGDRIVIARGAAKDGRDVISFHETAASVEAEVARLRAEGVREADIKINMETRPDAKQRVSTGFVGSLHALIDQSGADQGAKESLHQALQQLYLKSLPELSGAKHMIRRNNIEGYSTNAMRAFADAVTRGARYASHLAYAPVVQAAVESAANQSRSSDVRSAAVVIGRKAGAPDAVKVVAVGTDRLNAINEMERNGYTVEFFNTQPETAKERLAGALPGTPQDQIDAYAGQVEQAAGRNAGGMEDLRAAKTLYNHMVKLQNTEGNQDPTKVVEAMGQIGYLWYLGFTPAFWAMNALQNPMIGLPQLGAKYGVGKTAVEMGAAARWFSQVRIGKFARDRKTPFSVEWLAQEVKAGRLQGITKDELTMLQKLEDRQVLDFTQAMDINRISQASSSWQYKGMRLAAAGAHHTEVFNRVVFALTAYRLALKSDASVTPEAATDRAEKDTASAHFDYSYANKPELMRGKYARLLFMFQQYRQHMLYWWVNQVKDAARGETAEVRREAGKAMMLMGTTQLMFAGTMGLPFVGAFMFLANLVGGAFGDDDEPFDARSWIEDAAARHMPGSAATAFTHGLTGMLGMDISHRIGQAELLPFLNEGSANFERNPDDKARAYLFDLLGPLGSMSLGMVRALDSFSQGHTAKGIAEVAPKSIADIVKAYQLDTEGLKDKRGQFLATAEAFDGADVFMQAAGVAPSAVARIKRDRSKVADMDYFVKDRTAVLTTAFVEAWSRSDRDGMLEAVADIRAFNEKMAKKGLAGKQFLIDGRQLKLAIRDRQHRALMLALTGGTAETRRQLMIAMRMSGLNSPVTEASVQQNAVNLPGLPGLPGLQGQLEQ